jgi:hypothetical protein
MLAYVMLFGAIGCITAAAMVRWRMVEAATANAPTKWRFAFMRWYSDRNSTIRLWREHRRLHPRSKTRLGFLLLSVASALFALGVALTL